VVAPDGLQRGERTVTSSDWFSLILVLISICGLAFFAASEIAITRMNRVRALRLQEEGRRGATALVRIVENPAPHLNVVLFLTLLFTIGGTTIATASAVRHFHNAGEIVATIVMTLVLFVFAEVTPKTFAIQRTERVALVIAPPVAFLGRVLGPFANALLKLANIVMPGKGLKEGPYITEQELLASAAVASEEGVIEEEEKELIHSIFEFGDTIVREVMVPRPDVIAVEDTATLYDVQALVLEHGYSRIPVFHEDLDDILGVVFAKDVLKAMHQGDADRSLTEVCRPARVVPESKKVADLLREMQREKFHQAMVIDEYGSITGIVSLEDLLEELVGEITDEYDTEEPDVVEVGDGVYRVSGKASIDDVNEFLGAELPDEEWDTVAGLILDLFGKIPDVGEDTVFQGLKFEVEDVQGRRVAKVLITREPVANDVHEEVVGE
jgi:CBS domain containing-hemolysin-like protein